ASSDYQKTFASEIDSRAIGPNIGGYGKGKKSGGEYSLQIFGRAPREANCDCERTTDPTLLQTLYTRNNPDILGPVEGGKQMQPGWIRELRSGYGSPDSNNNRGGKGGKGGDKAQQQAKFDEKFKFNEKFRAKFKDLQPPKKPANDSPEAIARFKEQM